MLEDLEPDLPGVNRPESETPMKPKRSKSPVTDQRVLSVSKVRDKIIITIKSMLSKTRIRISDGLLASSLPPEEHFFGNKALDLKTRAFED